MNEFGGKKVTNVPNKVKAMKNLKKRINNKSGQNLWNLKTYNKLQSYWIGKNACFSVIFRQIECCYLHCMSLFILICSDESCKLAASLSFSVVRNTIVEISKQPNLTARKLDSPIHIHSVDGFGLLFSPFYIFQEKPGDKTDLICN